MQYFEKNYPKISEIFLVNNVENKTKLSKVRKDIKIVHEGLKGFKSLQKL